MASAPPLPSPIPLDPSHDTCAFDCGVVALNNYLLKYALVNERNRSTRTYVAIGGTRVLGYYSVAAASIRPEEATARVAKGLAKHPVPVILLARLAVDRTAQGLGLGSALLKDALLRCLKAADVIGCRAVLVHAKDAAAQTFYRKFGFESSPTDPLHLLLLLKDIQASLGS